MAGSSSMSANTDLWRGRIRLNKTHTGQIIGGNRNSLNRKNTYPIGWMLVFAGRPVILNHLKPH